MDVEDELGLNADTRATNRNKKLGVKSRLLQMDGRRKRNEYSIGYVDLRCWLNIQVKIPSRQFCLKPVRGVRAQWHQISE